MGTPLVLACAVAIAILLSPSLPWPARRWATNLPQWKGHEPISVTTRAEPFGVRKGDLFSYYFEVWYDPQLVAAIDKVSLDGAIDLAPFEVRRSEESEFAPGPQLRLYRREYDLQLIVGQVDQQYRFPSITVRYRPRDAEGLLSITAEPAPVFVASRLPAEIDDLELQPIAPTVSELGRQRLPWLLWGLGALLAALGAADLAWRVLPQLQGAAAGARTPRQGGVLVEAYRSLHLNPGRTDDPRRLLHQIDHLLRLVLAAQHSLDWLEEPDLTRVPGEVRGTVSQLFESCQQAYRPGAVEEGRLAEAMAQLDEALRYYYGAEELEAWRS